jgi:hypothetical protein
VIADQVQPKARQIDMNMHLYSVTVNVDHDVIENVLAVRPATWLEPFLRLAARKSRNCGPGSAPWYRLSPLRVVDRGWVAAPLVWWPHVEDDAVFSRFSGRLLVRPDTDRTTLSIEGETTGGTFAASSAMLSGLLELISAAVTAGQDLEG